MWRSAQDLKGLQEARGRRSATSGTCVLNGARLMRRFGSMHWLLGGAVVLGLLASVAGDLTAEDLVYSDAWGTQSACSGCSYIKGHVVEKPQEEVLQIDCICPPQVHLAPAPPTCSPHFAPALALPQPWPSFSTYARRNCWAFV